MGIRFQDGMVRDYLVLEERHTRLRTFVHIFALTVALLGFAVMLAWPAFAREPQVSESRIYLGPGLFFPAAGEWNCSQQPKGHWCHKVTRPAPSKARAR